MKSTSLPPAWRESGGEYFSPCFKDCLFALCLQASTDILTALCDSLRSDKTTGISRYYSSYLCMVLSAWHGGHCRRCKGRVLEPEEVLFNLLLWAVLCVCSAAFPTAEESVTQGRCPVWQGNLLRCETEQIFRFIFQACLFLRQRRGNHLRADKSCFVQFTPANCPHLLPPAFPRQLKLQVFANEALFWLTRTRDPLP